MTPSNDRDEVISSMPIGEIKRLLRVYGPAVPLKAKEMGIATRPSHYSLRRKFLRWNPDFLEHFCYHTTTSHWEPILGETGELQRRNLLRNTRLRRSHHVQHSSTSDRNVFHPETTTMANSVSERMKPEPRLTADQSLIAEARHGDGIKRERAVERSKVAKNTKPSLSNVSNQSIDHRHTQYTDKRNINQTSDTLVMSSQNKCHTFSVSGKYIGKLVDRGNSQRIVIEQTSGPNLVSNNSTDADSARPTGMQHGVDEEIYCTIYHSSSVHDHSRTSCIGFVILPSAIGPSFWDARKTITDEIDSLSHDSWLFFIPGFGRMNRSLEKLFGPMIPFFEKWNTKGVNVGKGRLKDPLRLYISVHDKK